MSMISSVSPLALKMLESKNLVPVLQQHILKFSK